MTCLTRVRLSAPLIALLLAVPATAVAEASSNGGAAVPEPASVTAATCASGESWGCRRGQRLTLTGTGMDGVDQVVFLGRRGSRDNRTARPTSTSTTELTVVVPSGARTGALRLRSPAGGDGRSRRRLRILEGPVPQADVSRGSVELAPGEPLIAGSRKRAVLRYSAVTSTTADAVRLSDGQVVRSWPLAAGEGELRWDGTVDGAVVADGRYRLRIADQQTASTSSADAIVIHDAIFPIRGRHDLGQSATNDFGGARGHGGQDMFAACGTPLVAVRPGVVQFTDFQSRAGNYLVLQDATGQSYAYMHMRDRALVSKGQKVRAGQRVGYVGKTGHASGCHLHFELWTAPGWYSGGSAVDPLPELSRWDAFS